MGDQPSTQPKDKDKQPSPPTNENTSPSSATHREHSDTQASTSRSVLPSSSTPRLRSFHAEAIAAFKNSSSSSSGAPKASSSEKVEQSAPSITYRSAEPAFKLVILPPVTSKAKQYGGEAVANSDEEAEAKKQEKEAKGKAREELDGKELVKDILDELLEEDASKRIMTFKPIPAEEIEEAKKLPFFPCEYGWAPTDDEADIEDYDKDQWERIQRGRQLCIKRHFWKKVDSCSWPPDWDFFEAEGRLMECKYYLHDANLIQKRADRDDKAFHQCFPHHNWAIDYIEKFKFMVDKYEGTPSSATCPKFRCWIVGLQCQAAVMEKIPPEFVEFYTNGKFISRQSCEAQLVAQLERGEVGEVSGQRRSREPKKKKRKERSDKRM